ncbi:MAG: class I SAM-dependent methyltransferase [Candidatus Sumerlaeaceae bacterium]
MLEPGNIRAIDYAIQHLPAGSQVVEIGSFCGLSTNVITWARRRHGCSARFFTCDKWQFEGADAPGRPMGDGGLTFGEFRMHVRDSFLRNLRTFSRHDLPYTLEMLSDEFFQAWSSGAEVDDVFKRTVCPGGAIGFCYIDGNHTYKQAKKDFLNTDSFLTPGGFILFDDSADDSPFEVNKVVQEALANHPYDLVARCPNYLLVKRES